METDSLERKIKILPQALKKEASHYIDYLIEKYDSKKNTEKGFTFEWEEGLRELKEKYTSVELQHKAKEWR